MARKTVISKVLDADAQDGIIEFPQNRTLYADQFTDEAPNTDEDREGFKPCGIFGLRQGGEGDLLRCDLDAGKCRSVFVFVVCECVAEVLCGERFLILCQGVDQALLRGKAGIERLVDQARSGINQVDEVP